MTVDEIIELVQGLPESERLRVKAAIEKMSAPRPRPSRAEIQAITNRIVERDRRVLQRLSE